MNLRIYLGTCMLVIMAVCFSCKSTQTATKAATVSTYSPAGSWDYVVTGVPNGDQSGVMVITENGDSFSGRIESDMGGVDLDNFKIDNGELSGSFDFDGYQVDVSGKFEGDNFSGTMGAAGYEFPLTATRKK